MRRARRAANVQKMQSKFANVEVQIDELILHGLFASNRYDIGDAFSHELELLLGEVNLDSSVIKEGHIRVLRTDQITVSPKAKPALVGMEIAQAVHGGLNSINKGSRS
ncbi:MAG: hypothetical protein JW730_18915 [Anaerolineales bacterium]|nr:hypothetical protein [Anaerolineales bacterium]